MTGWLIMLAGLVAVTLLWPRLGLLARWHTAGALAQRILREDALKHVLKCEVNGNVPSLESLAGRLQLSLSGTVALIDDLQKRGLLSFADGKLRLEPAGRDLAWHIIRAHRLWESYLSEETGTAETDWHAQAEHKEHLLSPQDADALAARLGHPTHDPHGDRIPERGEPVPRDRGMPLNAAELNQPLEVTHVEDEPSSIYAQLTAQGIRPGMHGMLIEKLSHRLKFWADGQEHVLAPILANNISVEPLTDRAARDLLDEEFLAGLEPGQTARILGLAGSCRGPERRRLLDLGFVPGTEVVAETKSPGGDPIAYRIRGTLIALRKEQARLIRVSVQNSVPT